MRNRSKYPLLKNCLRIGIGTVEQTQYFLNNLKGIITNSDAILIDRGDLSREIPIERVPLWQKKIMPSVEQHDSLISYKLNI